MSRPVSSVARAATDEPLAAGDFSTWLRKARDALIDDRGSEVACGECVACCSSSYFILVCPDETQTLHCLPDALLAAAPGLPEGHRVLGYDAHGRCPMLHAAGCAIYAARPRTCRAYDCRIFAAAGLSAGSKDKAAINARVERWNFSYPTPRDRAEHRAVTAAATFVRDHAAAFPGGRVPTNPSQIALLAIKAYTVFIERPDTPPEAVALAVIAACREFDARAARTAR